MSAPDQSATVPGTSDPATWTEDDVRAAMESAYWFDMNATPERIEPYRGMHVAIFDKQIIDADRDFNELCRRLDTKCDTVLVSRLILRYIPTDEEALRFRY